MKDIVEACDISRGGLYLYFENTSQIFMEVLHVYKYAHNQVIVSLPFLIPGEYFPAVKIMKKKSEDAVYIFPVSWVVMQEGYERGGYHPCCTDIAK